MFWPSLLILAVTEYATGFRSVCYYTNWSQYRHGKGKFVPENVDPNLCTHLMYSFAKPIGNGIKAFEWNDDSTPWSKGMYERTMDLKKINPNLKILLAVGGYNEGSTNFHRIVDTANSRAAFVQAAISFLRQRNFDGLDLDWEYPAQRGSPPSDKQKFTYFMQELRQGFENEAQRSGKPRLLLTAALPAGKDNIDQGYDIPALVQVTDFISLMTYDLHGSWEPYTGMNSPLYAHTGDIGDQTHLNLDWVAQYYLQIGAPKEKLNIGLATYGRSFTLDNPNQHNIGSAAKRAGDAGQFTMENGFISYYEICDMIKSGAQVYDVPSQGNRYLVKGTFWAGYDDLQSITEKACYTRVNGFGGVMFWALDLDDFTGGSCNQGKYPLITSAVNEMNNPASTCPVRGNPNPALTSTSRPFQPQTLLPGGNYRPVTQQPVIPGNPIQSVPPFTFTLKPAPTHGPVTTVPQLPNVRPTGFVIPTGRPNGFVIPTQQPAVQNPSNPYAFTLPVQGATLRPAIVTFSSIHQTTVPPAQTGKPFNPLPTLATTQSNSNIQTGTTPAMTQTTTFDCTNRVSDFYADPGSCDYFYICANQVTYKVKCAMGLKFNNQLKHCDWAYNVQCNVQSVNQPVSQPTALPSVSTGTPVQTYKPAAVNGNTLTLQPTQLTASSVGPGHQQASYPNQNPSNPCANIQNGLLSHPSDCHKYYQCGFGITFEMTCKVPLVFNPNMGMCDFVTNVPSCAHF